jgi:hypothetical protein
VQWVGGDRQVFCATGEVVVKHQWWEGITEAAGVMLHCWYIRGIDVKIVLLYTISY